MDKGPWKWCAEGTKVFVTSDDFSYDVWLELTGDFDSHLAKCEYAEWVASKLNSPNYIDVFNGRAVALPSATLLGPAERKYGLERLEGLEFYLHESPDSDDGKPPVRLVMAMSFGDKIFCHRITDGNNGICKDELKPGEVVDCTADLLDSVIWAAMTYERELHRGTSQDIEEAQKNAAEIRASFLRRLSKGGQGG